MNRLPFRYSEYLDTLAKLTLEKEKAEFYYGLFSEAGFDEKVTAAARKDDRVQLYTLDGVVGYEKILCRKQEGKRIL